MVRVSSLLPVCVLAVSAAAVFAQSAPKYPNYPSETPAHFQPTQVGMDYQRREVMIPMRDGIRLHTVILVPNGAHHAGILLTRTPYSADVLTANSPSMHLGSALWGYDNAVETILSGGYIRVVQDIRGKYGSEGDYVMNRPLHGPLNPTPIDESTDTWDTIDWLVKHIPESNGKVGVLGISYDGFLSLMPLVGPHPALKVAVPMNPMVDGWRGDDWFHNGAFREQNLPYIYEQTATRANTARWLTSTFDDYDTYMRPGTAGELAKERGMEQIGFWRKVVAHPAYDSFWADQAVDQILARQPLTVPTMLVASLWDQEDIYGAIAVWKAVNAAQPETARRNLFLTLGPWHHGQEIEPASSLGAIPFNSDTGLYFRTQILAPFLAHYLQDNPPPLTVARVNAFETGANRWQQLSDWPSSCVSGCMPRSTPLYVTSGGRVSFTAPDAGGTAYDEYVSDPSRPVPYRTRPSQPVGYTSDLSWVRWLVDDQREFSGRPDVLTWTSTELSAPLRISGEPVVHLSASTSGTDSDWVVKLIDVYPDEVPGDPQLGGYQLPIAMDIFRGRYRTSLSHPSPLTPNQPLDYKFALPTANHVFLPGHRIMIQIQSSWFPLYDRNPQTYVPRIFFAKPSDFQRATQRIWHTPSHPTFVDMPVVPDEH